MKKLALLFVCLLTLVGCEPEDNGPNYISSYAKVINLELPEFFEKGETYDITATYLLPTPCHTGNGIQIDRGASVGDERRDIYIAGVVSYDAALGECTEEEEGEALEKQATFSIKIDEDEPYTFYLWTGRDIDNKNIFDTIEVPVGEPETPEEEEEEV